MDDLPTGLLTNILKQNKILYPKLISTRNKAEVILKNSQHKHFTNHDIQHSDRIIERLNILAKSIFTQLNEDECYILFAAAYLHDIGMQSKKYSDLKIIRDEHHLLSSDMIIGSIKKPKDYEDLDIIEKYAEEIALVVKGHRKTDLFSEDYNSFQIRSNNIQIRLLAALLRFADELDIDSRRVDFEKIKVEKDMSAESKLQWYKHEYVLGIRIESGLIKITYRFPMQYKGLIIEELITNYIQNHIQEEYEKFKEGIFWENGIRISFAQCIKKYSSLTPTLPNDSYEELKKLVLIVDDPPVLNNWNSFVSCCKSNILLSINKIMGLKYLRDIYVYRKNVEEEFEEFLRNDKKLFMVIGKPGTGKTNVLCSLSQRYSPSIFLAISENIPNIEEFELSIMNFLDIEKSFTFQTTIQKMSSLVASERKNVIIFIDGEFSHTDLSKPDFFIIQFLRKYSDNNIKIMISCRGDISTLSSNILPADISDKIHKQQYGATSDLNVSSILGDFTESEYYEAKGRYFNRYKVVINGGIMDDAKIRLQNPYLLRLFCESYKNSEINGPIRDIRYIDLCQTYWENVYNKIESKFDELFLVDIEKIFSKTAKLFRKKWDFYLTRKEFITITKKELFNYLINEAIITTEINNADGSEDYKYAFDEFQEYLMAEQILTERNMLGSNENEVLLEIESLIKHPHQVRFRFGLGLVEFSILLLEKSRDDNVFNKVLESIVTSDRSTEWLTLSSRCISKLNKIDENTIKILRSLSRIDNETSLIAVAETLGIISNKKPEAALIILNELSLTYYENVKIGVANAYFRFEEKYADKTVKKLLDIANTGRWRVRVAIAESLASLKYKNMHRFLPLIQLLIKKGDSNTLLSLSKSLKVIGPYLLPNTFILLNEIALEGQGLHKAQAVRSVAALANYGVNSAIEIFNTLCKNPDSTVREAVADSVHLVDKDLAYKIYEELSTDDKMTVRSHVQHRLEKAGEIDPDDVGIVLGKKGFYKRGSFLTVEKNDRSEEKFIHEKIVDSIYNAAKNVGGTDRKKAEFLAKATVTILSKNNPNISQISTRKINDCVEKTLIKNGHAKTAKAYLIFRFNKYDT